MVKSIWLTWNLQHAKMSRFGIDSELPKYSQFQSFLHSQITSSTESELRGGHLRPTTTNSISCSISPDTSPNNHNISNNNNLLNCNNDNNSKQNNNNTTSNNSDESSKARPHKHTTTMYPYVSSNHPATHASIAGMPGFSAGLDDKSCRYTY